jgi:peptidoglycan/LPS O-acetylase OafA/YrhL
MAWLIVKIDSTAMKDNPISFIGRAGYSVYAFHAPVAIWLCVLGSSWWLNALLVVAFGVSAYYLFERPLDRVGHSFAAHLNRVLRPSSSYQIPSLETHNAGVEPGPPSRMRADEVIE